MNYRYHKRLGALWAESGAWPDFVEVMRYALTNQGDNSGAGYLNRWSVLPGLCCQAAGGNPDWTEDLTLGWLLFYVAADLMDSVQDGDEPDAWWVPQGAGAALAAASGLYFSGSIALSRMHDQVETKHAAAEIVHHFYNTFLVMTSGQYNDLLQPQPTLEQYWQHAAGKSGAFFGLACWAGARLSTSEGRVLQAYRDYGNYLGILIQLMDDLDDIRLLRDTLHADQVKKIKRSLPVIFAQEVSPPVVQERLHACFAAVTQSQEAVVELVNLLDQCGAAKYVLVELEKYRSMAVSALDQANPLINIRDKLAVLVQEM